MSETDSINMWSKVLEKGMLQPLLTFLS